MSEEFKASDDLLEDLFGPPAAAAADLHELRVWCHGRTALTPTEASSRAREIIREIDPTWPARSLTNEKVTMPYGTRPRGFGMKIRLAESTIECLEAVAHGDDPVTTKWRSPHDYETLWPAQSQSWGTWVSQCQDRRGGIGGPEMRQHAGQLTLPYVHPAALMAGVRRGGTPYLDAVADVMVMDRSVWKFAALTTPVEWGMWTDGLANFKWLDLFPNGELAMWLRSAVCNSWVTSHQLARYMNLPTARSCERAWITQGDTE